MADRNSPIVMAFPVQIPQVFVPQDPEGDGLDVNSTGKKCVGQDASTGFRPVWGGGFRAGRIRKDPVTGESRRLDHLAIDIMAGQGADVRAIGPGSVPKTVNFGNGPQPGAGSSTKGGNYIVVDDARGWRWYFAHLLEPAFLQPGDIVVAGDLLGFVGRTGNAIRRVRRKDGSTFLYGCPHLHLSLTRPASVPSSAVKHPTTGARVDQQGRKVDIVPFLQELYTKGGWKRG